MGGSEAEIHRKANFPDHLDLPRQNDLPTRSSGARASAADVTHFGIASATWEAAVALAEYLCSTSSVDIEFDPPSPFSRASFVRRLTICDLGSGNCFLPLALSRADEANRLLIYATDLPAVVPLMERNTEHAPSVRTYPLPWGDVAAADAIRQRELGYVICSDLIFFPFLYAPLLRTLLVLTTPLERGSPPAVIFGYKERTSVKETPFLAALGRYFDLESVLSRRKPTADEPDPAWQRHRPAASVYLFVAQRRPCSLAADVAEIATWSDEEIFTIHGEVSGQDQWESLQFLDLEAEWT